MAAGIAMNALMHSFLKRMMKEGNLEVIDAAGTSRRYGDLSGTPVRIRFTTRAAELQVILHPNLKLAETFMDGTLVLEEGSIYDLLEVLQVNAARVKAPSWFRVADAYRYLVRRFRQINTPMRARRNIAHHYDLDGRLYKLFLDDDLQYSCAYFEDGVTSLDEAQLAKKRHIAAKLDMKPGLRVLDIGSGWGGLGLYLAERFDADVTGVTLSEEQHAVSNRRAEERGLAGRARFLLKDYRAIKGPFDRIVSVGMFEHVGVNHYRQFFNTCRNLLAPDGSMLLHSIGRFGPPEDTAAFIRKYIFPGGYIPAISEVMPFVQRSGLKITDIEILRLHYAKTLRLWRERFLAHKEEVLALYDQRFLRMWEFYLAAAEMAFRLGSLMNFQMQFVKDQEILPLTRDYMGAAEAKLSEADRTATDRRPMRLAGE